LISAPAWIPAIFSESFSRNRKFSIAVNERTSFQGGKRTGARSSVAAQLRHVYGGGHGCRDCPRSGDADARAVDRRKTSASIPRKRSASMLSGIASWRFHAGAEIKSRLSASASFRETSQRLEQWQREWAKVSSEASTLRQGLERDEKAVARHLPHWSVFLTWNSDFVRSLDSKHHSLSRRAQPRLSRYRQARGRSAR